MRESTRLVLLMVVGFAVLCGSSGCGDDDKSTTQPTPVTAVTIAPDSISLEVGLSISIIAEVVGGDDKTVDWYVNDILGGSAHIGLITQTNPARYAAPDSPPDSTAILLKAISTEDASMMDSCVVTVVITTIHVDASAGNDQTGTGSISSPVKSITRGLELAQDGMTVMVAPGVYDAANGEVFPLQLPANVALVGEDWENCVIRSYFPIDQDLVAIDISGTGCSFRKFTIEHDPASVEFWQVAVSVRFQAASAHVDSIRVLERADYTVLRISNPNDSLVENCYFVVDDGLPESHGVEISSDNDRTIMRNCTISGFGSGVIIQRHSTELLEGNTIEGNDKGLQIGYRGETEFDPTPDLGGGPRGGSGGNIIRNNSECGLRNDSTVPIYAIGNTWGNDPPLDGEDYCNQYGGAVVWE